MSDRPKQHTLAGIPGLKWPQGSERFVGEFARCLFFSISGSPGSTGLNVGDFDDWNQAAQEGLTWIMLGLWKREWDARLKIIASDVSGGILLAYKQHVLWSELVEKVTLAPEPEEGGDGGEQDRCVGCDDAEDCYNTAGFCVRECRPQESEKGGNNDGE